MSAGKKAAQEYIKAAQLKLLDAYNELFRANKLAVHLPECIELQQITTRLTNLSRALGKLDI